MARIAGKRTMACVMEIHVLHGGLIFYHRRRKSTGFGSGFILMAAVTVVECRAILWRMACKAGLSINVIVEINFCITFLEGKHLGMAGLATSLQLMGFMLEGNSFHTFAEFDGFLRSGDVLLVTPVAIP